MAKSAADAKQIYYRDARFLKQYDDIWQTVGKCVFCDLNEKYVFYEENGIVMTISLFAYIDGHFMIVPRRHVRSAKELSQLEWETIRKFSYFAKKLIHKVHGIKGVQLVQKDGADAQSTVEHIHFHCIPFDAPDLCVWNYRQLRKTPLENASLYKKARAQIIKHDQKFIEKYSNITAVPIVCDLLLINKQREVLLQERETNVKLSPDYLSLPGGTVDNYERSLEEELIREVAEEINLVLTPKQFCLLSSRLSARTVVRTSRQLKAQFPQTINFLWNTYVMDDFSPPSHLKPGDDCQTLVWLPLAETSSHKRVSPEVRAVIQLYMEKKQT
ncbi:MAG: hypothetical protein NVS1B7_6980 [Candidatus Saccharimonadales bacterium]